MNARPIQVLLVEDSEDDALLIARALKDGGLDVHIERYETAEGLRGALATKHFDIVLTDYSLPALTGREALEITKEFGNDLPVIVLSGSASEEAIVEIVKAGARDYLMKPKLTRLAVAVEREIQEAQDRRERRALEEQLRHAQRLESIGVLAGGVAHDFNNILTGILGNSSLASEILPANSKVRPLIDSVVSAAEHAAVLTRQLLAYAGKGRFMVELLDMSALVQACHDLLRLSVSRNIELALELQDGLPRVEADRGQMEQVLLNLVINAAEAIGPQVAGRVRIQTCLRVLPAGALVGNVVGEALEGGTYVCLEVSDSGPGIPASVQARMFDPFFTTKFTGRGLGLSAVVGVVRAHRGAMQVKTAPGDGATFTAYFPAAAKPRIAAPEASERKEPHFVLVIDEEEIARKTAVAVLQQRGLTVVPAESGNAGLDLFRRAPDRVALVLLDMNMAAASASATLAEVREIRPDVPILVSTSFSEAEARVRLANLGRVSLVRKPYGSVELASEVERAMNGGLQ